MKYCTFNLVNLFLYCTYFAIVLLALRPYGLLLICFIYIYVHRTEIDYKKVSITEQTEMHFLRIG